MNNRWNAEQAASLINDPLNLRVYTSRLLGQDPELVLHGGGNTSVKITHDDFFGDSQDLIYVKGSGWDLEAIEPEGFAPVRMETLLKMAEIDDLSDTDMVTQQRAAMTDPNAPNPSVEAILHALLPFKFVDHTHANALVALTNHTDGEARVREVYGDRVLIVPYVMPGFILAKTVAEIIKGKDLSKVDGLILMNHGIFTFSEDGKESYDRMIELVALAEDYLPQGNDHLAKASVKEDLLGLADLRKAVSLERGVPVLAKWDQSEEAVGYSSLENIEDLSTRGPLTPDHSIRTKRIPAVIGDNAASDVAAYAESYRKYFENNKEDGQQILPQDPRFAVWKDNGIVSFGASLKEANVISDHAFHTYRTVQWAEASGGWKPLNDKDVFDVEYWSLEQAKLKNSKVASVHQGKVAIVTGSAAGIGFACAKTLVDKGAVVIGLDLNPKIVDTMSAIGALGLVVNLTDEAAIVEAVNTVIRNYGGLDILVSNAGIFTAGAYLEDMEDENWQKSMAVNLTSHQRLLKHTIPFLKKGINSGIVLVGSRNVNAPGAGAASYSCAKAALTQLCRVAALELAPEGVRVNIIHPDAVFDTELWTPEALQRSAERYGLTVDEYKTRNLMKTEILSANIGEMVSTMAGPVFGKTTGAQIPVDGGNDRII
jgi:rhamnose utilization protein RhaD (predicted bifunctional aldolase and dehydrogenase)/NAD(P)-dependent dehydrogenase (short-subunit alcohol dehydrogenase family)